MNQRIAVACDNTGTPSLDDLAAKRIDLPPHRSEAASSPRISTGTAHWYSVEVRSLAQNRAIISDAASESLARPPPLDLDRLHRARAPSVIRRKSTNARRLDEAPDSLRLESTRRRVSTVMKEPSRASVVYSPRALMATTRRKSDPTPHKSCSVM